MEKAINNIRTVHFMCARGCEDLYRCHENGKVYARQECGRNHVRWLTTSALPGGYECLMPMRDGLVMRIVDASGTLLFEEHITKVAGANDTCATKTGDFSSDLIKSIANSFAESMELRSWYDWKDWMKQSSKKYQYRGYNDNWQYVEVEYSERTTLCSSQYLGKRIYITSEKAVHKISGQTWECIEVRDESKLEVLAICGYKFQ